MPENFFEDLLNKPSIFLDESKLDINFVPEMFVHREEELSLLSQLFLGLITNPNSISRKILITGKTGIGKTMVLKIFGKKLIEAAEKRNININYVHVNCRKERTSYKVLLKIIQSLNERFPKRGYSPQDLLEKILDYLIAQNSHLVLVLDELNYLIYKNGDLIYFLTRLNDDSISNTQRLSFIGIVRDPSCLSNLDAGTISGLQGNIIKFKMYSREQIFEILKYRAKISIKKEGFSDEILHMISDLVLQNGDIRYGLNILWRAGKIAESKGLKRITPECIHLCFQENRGSTLEDTLKLMTPPKLMYLLSIIKSLKNSKEIETSMSQIQEVYNTLCETNGISPRSYQQIWNFLQEFKKQNIISINTKTVSNKARKTF